jgi:hypothetical protein
MFHDFEGLVVCFRLSRGSARGSGKSKPGAKYEHAIPVSQDQLGETAGTVEVLVSTKPDGLNVFWPRSDFPSTLLFSC